MAAVSLGPPLWSDGPTYNAESLRQVDVSADWFCGGTADALQVRGGVISNSVGSLQVLAVSGLSVKVASGFAIVPNTTSNVNGGYKTGTMASVPLTVGTANATNPRIDLVVIGVNENGDSTSNGYINIIAGTPAASPVAPATPANAIALGTIQVNANSSSVAQTNITDKRTYTSAAGGVIPWPSLTGIPAGHPGLIAYDVSNSRFFHNDSSGADQLSILPWKPVYKTINADTNLTMDGYQNVLGSVTFTTDGHTDIKVTTHWPGIYAYQAGSGWEQTNMMVFLDSTQISASWGSVDNRLTNIAGATPDGWNGTTITQWGGTDVYCTSSATGDTPSSGTHTVYWKCTAVRYGPTNNSGCRVRADSTENAYIRVEPVIL